MPVVASAPMAGNEPEPEDEDGAGEAAEAESQAPQPVLPDLVDSVAETIASLRRKGFGRLYVDGQTVTLDDADTATLKDRPVLQVIVDRVKVDAEARVRLTDSIETAYTEGDGAAFAIEADGGDRPTGSASGSSAASATSRTRCRSRGSSRSTTRSARARSATASATSSSSTWRWSCPTRPSRSSRTRSSRGASRTTARSSPS